MLPLTDNPLQTFSIILLTTIIFILLLIITYKHCVHYRLGNNSIGDTGAMSIGEGIKHCTQLRVLG